MRSRTTLVIILLLTFLCLSPNLVLGAVNVTSFDPSYTNPGNWYLSDMRAGGTASIVDLTGEGGDLENNQPLPTGAAKLTTQFNNGDKAEVAVSDSYGTVSSMLSSLLIGYSYYKENVPGGNAFAAPSIKLTFFNSAYSGDGYVTLVYEPNWNQPSNPGASIAVPTNAWTAVNIDFNTGLFWQNGGFGQSNTAGGPPLKTLSGWGAAFDNGFQSAQLITVTMGVGTYNQGQVGYFDDVSINNNSYSRSYDFGPAAAIPEPATIIIWSLLGGLGLVFAWRKRKAA